MSDRERVIKRRHEWRLDESAWRGTEFSVLLERHHLLISDIAGAPLVKPRNRSAITQFVSQADSGETLIISSV